MNLLTQRIKNFISSRNFCSSRISRILLGGAILLTFFCDISGAHALIHFPSMIEQLSIESQLQKSIKKPVRLSSPSKFTYISREKYTRDRMIASMEQSIDKQIRKLSQYKNKIQGTYGEEMMVFLHMPITEEGVDKLALNMNNIIIEYKRHSVTPIFLFEPYDENLKEIHFGELKKGTYDSLFRRLFLTLRDTYNISSRDIGMIVPYPEMNTPAYKRTGFKPEDFSLMVNRFFRALRSAYPESVGGLLLDSKSYDIGEDWGDGSFESFLPYIKDIDPGSIQRFGIQGFPWVSNNGKIEAYDPKEFIPFGITHEAASKLGVKSIWMNTGVMRKKYRTNTIIIPSQTSEKILTGIMNQAKNFTLNGYDVLIIIFAQNKYDHDEVTDWSFLGDENSEKILQKFLLGANAPGVKVSIYDK